MHILSHTLESEDKGISDLAIVLSFVDYISSLKQKFNIKNCDFLLAFVYLIAIKPKI